MTLAEFIAEIVKDGIEAAGRDYSRPDATGRAMRSGAVDGFKACLGKTPDELRALLASERKKTESLRRGTSPSSTEDAAHYWYQRCKEAEIEWVCGCVSVVLNEQGGEPISGMTARQVLHSARVLKRGRLAEVPLPS